MHETSPRPALALWPPDDTEESVLGTHLHQDTITNARTGINEVAVALAEEGREPPFRAGGQTLITGLRRPDGSTYPVLPDVFVYPYAFDMDLPSMSLLQHGPPSLAVEVLSHWTWRADVDMAAGKGWTYADAGIQEYLILDPAGRYLGAQGQGWRLEGSRYVPWLPDEQGRWASTLGFGLGFEGLLLIVSLADGRPVPREGRILRSLAESRARGLAEGEARGLAEGEARGLAEGEARGLAEGVLVGRAMLLRLLAVRFGALPSELEARLLALVDLASLDALADVALTASSLDAFAAALGRRTG